MKANITNNKKNTTMRKIVPAAGMLSISAVMLATSTYAWFTMSREVEVSNISMSATVPEDIQISLGKIGTTNSLASTKESVASLKNGKGLLVATNNVVEAPANAWDWDNIADISEYYQFGKLMPSSSTDGTNIYFTPDADGVGKTIKSDAKFYTAASSGTAQAESTVGSGTGKLNATAHVITSKNNGIVNDAWKNGNTGESTGNYTTSSAWNVTGDDGYYIDIPVWLRTSSVKGADVSVKAYVKPRTTTQKNAADGEALYRAVRVAILEETSSGGSTSYTNKTNLIPVADGWNPSADGTAAGTLKENPFGGTSVLDWYTRESGKQAVSSLSDTTATYGEAVQYTANATVATLAAPTQTNGVKSDNYGAATKLIVRVWLEGEDKDCWNDTAGQDWSINLKFNNETTNNGGGSNSDISGTNLTTAPKES